MKLVSFEPDARLGVTDGDSLIDLASLNHFGAHSPETMDEFIAGWPRTVLEVRDALNHPAARKAAVALNERELILLPPLKWPPGKIVAAAVNYQSHGAEQNREPPDHPVFFAKFTSSIIGSGDSIRWSPRLTQAVDFEAELAVVMGKECRRVSVESALDYVAGYTCLNDVSARDLQYSDKQFVRAKSLDTFCPIGPWLVTADEIADPQDLSIRCFVNGELMQDGNTSDMVFSVAELISFCSHAFTLWPGDVIATGTPSGVGWFREPKRMLTDGDEVVVEIERIGRLVNRCVEEVT